MEIGVTLDRVVRGVPFEKVNLFLRRNQLWENPGEGPLESGIGKACFRKQGPLFLECSN